MIGAVRPSLKDYVSPRRLLTKAEMLAWANGWECLEQEEA